MQFYIYIYIYMCVCVCVGVGVGVGVGVYKIKDDILSSQSLERQPIEDIYY